MVHIMFPDLTAHDVSFPTHTQTQKKKKGQRKAEPEQVQFTKVGGRREDKGEQRQRGALKIRRNKLRKKAKVSLSLQVSEVPKTHHICLERRFKK